MYGAVRFFRATFVEGRFIPLLGTLGFLAMRFALFLNTDPYPMVISTSNHVWNPIAHLTREPEVSFIASTISVLLIAWLLSRLNSRFNLIRSRSNLPYVVPLFLFSIHPYFLVMTGDWVAIFFILLAFFPLLESYQKPDSYLYSFRGAVLIGLASLFQVFALALLPLWWRGERVMRGGQARSFISSLFGLFLVYISLFSTYLLLDNVAGFLQPLTHFMAFSLPDVPPFTLSEWGGVVLVGLYFVVNMMLAAKIYSRDKVLTLTFTRFVVFLIVMFLLLQIVYWKENCFFLLLSILLVTFLSSYLFTRTNSKSHIYLAYAWTILMLLFYIHWFYPFLFA